MALRKINPVGKQNIINMEKGIPEKFQRLYYRLRRSRIPYRISFIIIGVVSTAWFLIRVIPKPTRAGYPCMRVAAPFMSSFVVYLLALTGSVFLLRRARKFLYQHRFAAAAFAAAAAVAADGEAARQNEGQAHGQDSLVHIVDGFLRAPER